MTNAEKFQQIFNLYATELWALPEKDFLEWLNTEIQPEKEKKDTISRQAAIDALCDNCNNVQAVCPHYPCKQFTAIEALPSAQPEVIRGKDCKHYYYADNRIPQEQRYVCDLDGDRWKDDSFCSYAERRTDE